MPWCCRRTIEGASGAGAVVNIALRSRRAAAPERLQAFWVFAAWLLLMMSSALAVPGAGARHAGTEWQPLVLDRSS